MDSSKIKILKVVKDIATLIMLIDMQTFFQVNVSELVDALMTALTKFKLMVHSGCALINAPTPIMVIRKLKCAQWFAHLVIHIRIF